MFDSPPETLNPLVTAKIIYNPASPLFKPDSTPDATTFDETQLIPIHAISASPADVSHDYNVYFGLFEDGVNHGTFNNIVYSFPIVPSIYTALSGSLATDERAYGSVSQVKLDLS
jgi:iron transport multicopper oxidase